MNGFSKISYHILVPNVIKKVTDAKWKRRETVKKLLQGESKYLAAIFSVTGLKPILEPLTVEDLNRVQIAFGLPKFNF